MPSPQPPNRIQTSTVGMLTFLLKLISLSHRRCPPGVYEDSTPGLRTNLFKLVYAVLSPPNGALNISLSLLCPKRLR